MKRTLLAAGFLLLSLGSRTVNALEPMHLTLTEAQRLSLKNNPRITEAVLNAAAALQAPVQYRAAYLPTLSGNVTAVKAMNGSRLAAGGLNNPVVYDRFATGLTLSQMVTDFGRTKNLINMARLRADAQNQAAEQSRADIMLVTGQAYFALLREQVILRVAQQTVATRKLLADKVSALAQSNLKSNLDVSFANVNLADAKLLLIQAENALKAGEVQLATVMALPEDTHFVLTEEPLPSPDAKAVEDLVQTALDNRPEIKGLRLEHKAAEKFVRAEHALHYPNIAIVGSAGFVPAGQQPQVQERYGAVGVNLNIPIFNGGLFTSRETEARLREQSAQQHVNTVKNDIARDVRVAVLNEKSAYDRVALSEQLLEQAKTALDLAESRYDLGLSSIVELSQAQLNATTAQIASESAKYDYQAQRLNVNFQLGELHY